MSVQRTVEELDRLADKWWPTERCEAVAKASLVPLLIESQDRFLALLKLSGDAPEQIFDVLTAAGMPANLFLKHLAVLADYGGEPISRLSREFKQVFPPDPATGQSTMRYQFRQQAHVYTFRALPRTGLSNTRLKLDGCDPPVGMLFDIVAERDGRKIGVHRGRVRRITPREYARLQGFPDKFVCHPVDTHAYRQFGNSVSVPVVKAVGLDMFQHAEPAFLHPQTRELRSACKGIQLGHSS